MNLTTQPANDNNNPAITLAAGDCFATITRSVAVVSGRSAHIIPVNRSGALVIYGEVTDIEDGQVFGRCYSKACKLGEYGYTPLDQVRVKLTRAEFDRAAATGWPSDKATQRRLVGHR